MPLIYNLVLKVICTVTHVPHTHKHTHTQTKRTKLYLTVRKSNSLWYILLTAFPATCPWRQLNFATRMISSSTASRLILLMYFSTATCPCFIPSSLPGGSVFSNTRWMIWGKWWQNSWLLRCSGRLGRPSMQGQPLQHPLQQMAYNQMKVSWIKRNL